MPQKPLKFGSGPSKMQKLGRYLKNLREELGLSMHEVARRSSLTPSYISKIETGNVFKSINTDSLVNFSNAYEIPVIAILEEAGFLEKSKDDLPGFATYLKLKYRFPHQAIRDMEIAREIMLKKYKK